MLTRTATRRSAAVAMMALVAMLLVATGGSARAAQPRVSAGTGQATAAPQHVRHVVAVPSSSHDHLQLHLDLASTPPSESAAATVRVVGAAAESEASHVVAAVVTVDGRAPPAR